jgi:hypothetical protein
MKLKNLIAITLLAATPIVAGFSGCEGNPDPNYNGSEGQKIDQQVKVQIEQAVPALKEGVKQFSDSAPVGLLTGDTDKIVHGAKPDPLPQEPCPNGSQHDKDGDCPFSAPKK